jgi:hypothetical protein
MGSQVKDYDQTEIDRMEEKMRSAIVPAEPQEIENANALTLVLNQKNWALTHPVEYQARMHNILVDFVQRVMVKDVDYGHIKGCGDKPMLFKAGAEKTLNLFRMSVRFELVNSQEDWDKPLFSYNYKATVRGPDGQIISECDSNCNSWESKYRYRMVSEQYAKPDEKAEAVGKKSTQKGPMLLLPNKDIYSQINTIQKMAQKRAMVGAVLIAANASAFFQNLDKMAEIDIEEDFEPIDAEIVSSPVPSPKPTPKKAPAKPQPEQIDIVPELTRLRTAFKPVFSADEVKAIAAKVPALPEMTKEGLTQWTKAHLNILEGALQEAFEARIDVVEAEYDLDDIPA